jgi:hypothetical protein
MPGSAREKGDRLDTTFRIPDTDGPDITIRTSWLGVIKVLANGVPVRRSSRRKMVFAVPMTDGTSTELQIGGQLTGLTATVNGTVIPLQRRLARWEVVLVFAPLVLVLGGLLGGVFAAIGAGANTQVVRRIRSMPVRIGVMLGTTVAVVGLYLATLVAIAPVPRLEVGTCVNGVTDGTDITLDSSHAVNCNSAHDHEVVGETRYRGNGPFPGNEALGSFAQTPCIAAFRSYVGIDFGASTLDMALILPTDLTWAKGDRLISCVVVSRDGTPLTGSVRGTAR